MEMNNEYKKISWIYEIHEIFENNELSRKRLDTFAENIQKYFVYKSLCTLSKYFSQIPDEYSEISMSDINSPEKLMESLSNTLPTWLSGLCDLTIKQIVDGLMDILNLKTEYQKWPPKSVMQFHAVCRSIRPAPYHDIKTTNDLLRIDNLSRESEKKPENINELDDKGRRLYDEKSGNKIEYHPVHGKRLFSVSMTMPNDKEWFKALTPELKEKTFKSAAKSWTSLEEVIKHDKDCWNCLDDGFERSPWFKPMMEAFRTYYKINAFTDMRFFSR